VGHAKLDVWAFPFDADEAPLPSLKAWEISPTDGDWGSVKFDYPATGRNFSLLDAVTEDDIDLEVEVTLTDLDGQRWAKRALILDFEVDDVDDNAVGTATGVFLEYLFSEVVFPYFPGEENGETPVAGTAGRIVRELMEAAQGRGCLDGITWSFTDTEDSNGVPWSNTTTLRFSPGQTYAAMLGTLTGYGLSEWELTNTRELRLYNGSDGKGVDRTVGASPLTLERGRDLADAPRKHTLRSAITALITAGKDGLYSAASDATAQGRRRRRIEGFFSFGNAADQGSLDALTQARLGTEVDGTMTLSHALALGDGHPTPLIDFGPSDWVYSATRRDVSRRRVKQVTLSGEADEVNSASVTLNALIDELAARQQKQIDDMASGAATVGTSTPPPDIDPGTTPDTPDDLVANSLWYSTTEGVGLTALTASWSAVPDSTVVGYLVEWRYTDPVYGSDWQQLPQVDATNAAWSGVNAGAAVEVRVSAVGKWGRNSPASAPYAFVTELDGTPPPVASAATPYAALGLVIVPWDGLGSVGEPMPGDFEAAEIHISTTSAFTADRPLDGDGHVDLSTSTTYAGEMRAAMEFPIDVGTAGYGTTFYVVLVTRDRTGNAAAQSAQASVTAAAVADDEIGAMSIGKLTTGILTAFMTVSGMIRTALSGSRVELDAAGIRCYLGSTIVLNFDIPNAALSILGKFTAGASSTTGARVVVDPAYTGPLGTGSPFPSIVLSDGGTVGPAVINAVGGGGNGKTSLGLNSGPNTTVSNPLQSTLLLYPDSAELHVNQGGQSSRGGRVYVSGAEARVAYSPADAMQSQLIVNADGASINGIDAAGATQSYVWAQDNGDLALSGDRITTAVPMGTTGSGLFFMAQGDSGAGIRASVAAGNGTLVFVDNDNNAIYDLGGPSGGYKTFVIDHPIDPARYLVHVATESPQAGVEYWGEATITGGLAEVALPDYFEPLVEVDGRQVQCTTILSDEPQHITVPTPVPATPDTAWVAPAPVRREVPPTVWPAAASRIRDGKFTVRCDGPDGTVVAWLVKAVRKGPPVEVEPLRSTVDPHGDGPYRYLTPREQAA
jgi:hypothetical protein